MQVYRYDVTERIVSPHEGLPLVVRAIDVANGNAKERTISGELVCNRLACANSIGELWLARSRFWEDGGGVVRRSGPLARTSVLGVVWFMDNPEVLHLRVIGDRIDAPQSANGCVGPLRWGLRWNELSTIHNAALVYPALYVSRQDRFVWRDAPIDLDDLARNPCSGDDWAMLEDWAEEHLGGDALARVRKARLTADIIGNATGGLGVPYP